MNIHDILRLLESYCSKQKGVRVSVSEYNICLVYI